MEEEDHEEAKNGSVAALRERNCTETQSPKLDGTSETTA